MSPETETATAAEEQTQPGYETFTTKANKNEGAREIEITWNVGKDLDESRDIFGAEVVHSMFKKAIVIAAQANIRRMLEATKENSTDLKYSDDDIKNFIYTQYKPGVRAAREGGSSKSMEAVIKKLMALPVEERKKLLGIE
jgi:hypothetical protein